MTKTCFRFFTITDYEKEEQWLHAMFLKGWKLVSVRFQCIYTFTQTEPADMAVRLEYSDIPLKTRPDYEVMMKDYGWECLSSGAGWNYFARPTDAQPVNNELFTDDVSRLSMIRKIFQKRYLVLFLVLIFLILPAVVTTGFEKGMNALFIGWIVLAGIYIFALAYCGIGFQKLLKKYDLKMDMTPSVRGLMVCALAAVVSILFLIAAYLVGGAFRDFWLAALPWVLCGIGLLALMIYTTTGNIDA
ncbi:DUF2812 domain-containing protein [Catenisphaera adipataccumulans]|uniref:DUF2812 domain-containing protein n=1 Tax=Catenisphaera adipataccumulans TaxID=700500 RepID=A0A7W8FV02_9FIRM|nr:DUF2812 domain-containing protein [Catenisphaera adipataccumulans]MBB5182633.1 hypothetical protein [Catenisphaera adipataccumulans]